MTTELTAEAIGNLVKNTRKQLGINQKDLAISAGTGLRFIIDLEGGKPTCQLGKVLIVLKTLGITAHLIPPLS